MNVLGVQRRVAKAFSRVGSDGTLRINTVGGDYTNPSVTVTSYAVKYVIAKDSGLGPQNSQEMPTVLEVEIPARSLVRPTTNDSIVLHDGQEYFIRKVTINELLNVDLSYHLFLAGTVK